jgi:hypothetical protein
MGILDTLFGKRTSKEDLDLRMLNLSDQEERQVHDFRMKAARERMGLIMMFGDHGDPGHWGLMRYALLLDPDKDVTFAALKRIGNFADKKAASNVLLELDQRRGGDSLEPYLSMAKHRLGLMTIEEFEQRMNRAAK